MSDRHLTRTAVFVILEKDNKIFFLRRSNTGWADGMLTVPAGHVDKGDQVTEAAIKETREEACVEIKAEDLEFVHVDFLRDEYTNFYFKAKKWKGEPRLGEPELASEALWIDKDKIPDDVTPQLRRLFEQIAQSSYFSEIEREV
ncbi:NUDIX domain-containing protein [Candidatus Kaiserbacteria bacterium]|nr:NUDIX domain-containing protein [Candidatus Kaiserbacteria bacterium]